MNGAGIDWTTLSMWMHRRRRVAALTLLVALQLALAPRAVADVGFASDGELGFISRFRVPLGGPVGSLGATAPMSGLALSPHGELFGVVLPYPPSSPPMSLARVEQTAFALDVRGPLQITTSSSAADVGLAFDAAGNLWLVTEEGRLYQIDPVDATATLRVDFHTPLRGLAGCGASLFSLRRPEEWSSPLQLVRIDPMRGTVVAVGPEIPTLSAGGVGLDFSTDGRLWGVLQARNPNPTPFSGSASIELDPVTGLLIQNVAASEQWFQGLALAPPPASCPGRGVAEVPALSPWGITALAVLLAAAAGFLLRRSPPPA